MAEFEPLQTEIEALGSSLLFIAAEKRSGMFKPERFLSKHPVSFPFLLDEDRAVIKAYGIHNRLALDAIDIAKPATFVVDRSGRLRYIYVGKKPVGSGASRAGDGRGAWVCCRSRGLREVEGTRMETITAERRTSRYPLLATADWQRLFRTVCSPAPRVTFAGRCTTEFDRASYS
jgi:hypothetical protein